MMAMFDPAALPLLVLAVVFCASALQAITGIGFGVIAGPVLLVHLGSIGAIQTSIALSFLIAVLLAPLTLPKIRPRLLGHLFIGIVIGTPLGAVLAVSLAIGPLKLFAAGVVGFMTLVATGVLSRFPIAERDSPARRIVVGAISGTLNTALAMPGPPIAAYATAIRGDKDMVRATTLVAFLFAYPLAFGAQAGLAGIASDFWLSAPPLILPTAAGTLTGMACASRINGVWFKRLTVVFLMASTAALVLF